MEADGMPEYIEREAAIESIISEPQDAHYPHWYAVIDPLPMHHRRNVGGWLAVYIVQSVIYPARSAPYSVVAIALSAMNFFYLAHQRSPLDILSHCQHLTNPH